VKVNSYGHISLLEKIHYSFIRFNQDAIAILGEITRLDQSEEVQRFVDEIPIAFCVAIEKNWTGFQPHKGDHIHSLDPTFHGPVPDLNTFLPGVPGEFRTFPPPLAVQGEELFNHIPKAMRRYVDSMERFVNVLHESFYPRFTEFLKNSLAGIEGAAWYPVHAAVFLWLAKMRKPVLVDTFFDVLLSKVIFDPSDTIFGPYVLDPIVNEFRAAVFDIILAQAPNRIPKILSDFRTSPFLASESVGRFSVRGAPLDLTKDNQIVTIVKDAAIALRTLGAAFDARTPLFMYFIELLTNVRASCLTNEFFMATFLPLLCDQTITDHMFMVLERAMTALPEPGDLGGFPRQLLQFGRLHVDLPVLELVLKVVQQRPGFVTPFSIFLDQFIAEVSDRGSQKALDQALRFLMLVSNAQNNFVLSPEFFRILAGSISESDYSTLLGLCAGGTTVRSCDLCLFRRPLFLALLLIAIGKNATIVEQFLRTCLRSKQFSDYNLRKLHEGDVDAILLSALAKGPQTSYHGFSFVLNLPRALAIEVLTSLAAIMGNRRIATLYADAINQEDIRKSLYTALLQHRADIEDQYPIGAVPQSRPVALFTSNDFAGPFSICFRLRNDASVLVGLPLPVPLIALSDTKRNVLTIGLLNNVPHATFDMGNIQTIVSICARPTSNIWTHFVVVFPNEMQERVMISTFKDGVRLQGSEFMRMAFSGPVELAIGGGSFPGFREEFGSIAQIVIYKQKLLADQVWDVMFDDDPPSGFLFSSQKLSPRLVAHSLRSELLIDGFRDASLIRKLVLGYLEIRDDLILAIVSLVIANSQDTNLPVEFASKLTNPSLKTYFCLVDLVSVIQHEPTRLAWFEELLINRDLWGWNRRDVILHWNSILVHLHKQFFTQKSYFSYFLEESNDLVPEAETFLRRIASLCFVLRDAQVLFAELANTSSSSPKIRFYLTIIRDFGRKFNEMKYNQAVRLFPYLESPDQDIIVLTIECLYILLGDEFYSSIVQILQLIKPSEELLRAFEARVSIMPGFFCLNCAIALLNRFWDLRHIPGQLEDPSSPGEGGLLKASVLWYMFPVLLFVVCDETLQSDIANFLARNILRSESLVLTTVSHYVSLFGFVGSKDGTKLTQMFLFALIRQYGGDHPLHWTRLLLLIESVFCYHFDSERFCPQLRQLFLGQQLFPVLEDDFPGDPGPKVPSIPITDLSGVWRSSRGRASTR
jgi:hypothetical protein